MENNSRSTVKTDRNGLQFFWKHVLGRLWNFVEIINPPVVKTLFVTLTPAEIERMLNAARKLRYYTILLTLYSMDLRLAEGLNLTIFDIDSERMRVHVRNGKGGKDRYVDLPARTLTVVDWITIPMCTLWFRAEESIPAAVNGASSRNPYPNSGW